MNYLHNRILVDTINQASWELLMGINNTKISDLSIGEHIKFAASNQGKNIINEDATWVVADIVDEGDSKKYYFLSDMSAHNLDIKYKLTTDLIEKYHAITIDVYRDLLAQGVYNNLYMYPNIQVTLPTASLLNKVRDLELTDTIKNAIFGIDSDYIVYNDLESEGYSNESYYLYRMYRFNEANQSILNKYCSGTFNGERIIYNSNNKFGYLNVMVETAKNTKYIDYCSYASPITYSHSANEHVVLLDEMVPGGDIVTDTYSSLYPLRLMATLEVNVNDDNTYLAGGKGTAIDPYLFRSGVKE